MLKKTIKNTEDLIKKIEDKSFKNEIDRSILKTLKQGVAILKDPNYNPNDPFRRRRREEKEKQLKDQQNTLIL